MATLLELQQQRDRLLANLGSPEKRVAHGDKSVEYRDVDQAKMALDVITREIARMTTPLVGRQWRIQVDKDL